MINKTISILWAEAQKDTDRDIYLSDWALSSIFPEDSDLAANAELVGRIWDVAHMTVREIVAESGLKRTACAQLLCIPYRTLTAWCNGARECGDYIRLWMALLLGLIEV